MLPGPSQIRVLGPLSPFAAGFADELARQGFTAHSAGCLMRLTAHLSRWLIDEGLDASDLGTAKIEQFLRVRRDAGYTELPSINSTIPLNLVMNILKVAQLCPCRHIFPWICGWSCAMIGLCTSTSSPTAPRHRPSCSGKATGSKVRSTSGLC